MKDLNLLYVFEAIWRTRSVTQAAESLGVTQAGVSGALKRLRQEHDDVLFVLVGRRMEPTPYAMKISQQLLNALHLIQQTKNTKVSFEPGTSRRIFTVRTRDVGEVACFPNLLTKLENEAPGIQLRTLFQPIDETLHGLASGRIDLALGFLPSLETAIHRRSHFSQNYVCVMREGHPLGKQPLTHDAFCSQNHLLVENSGSGHQVIEKSLIKLGLRDRIKARLPQYLSAPYFIMSSNMLWCAPEILAHKLTRNFPLLLKPLPFKLPTFEIALYWHVRFNRDPANQWLRQLIVNDLDVHKMQCGQEPKSTRERRLAP